MKRRVGREDFKLAGPSDELESGSYFFWDVYEELKLVEEDGPFPYFRASVDRGSRYYRPLVDTPYLFLEFARVAEHKGDPYAALHTWIRKYGLLGLSNPDPTFSLGVHPEEDLTAHLTAHADRYPEVSVPPVSYIASGGPGDTYDAYLLEVAKANKLLTLYEALLSQDSERLVQCFAFHEGCSPEALRDKWRSELEENRFYKPLNEGYWSYWYVLDDRVMYESQPTNWNAFLMDKMLRHIWDMVAAALSIFAYPSITALGGLGPLSPDKLTTTLRARNLLGAMYLQFYWLITSAGALSRCKYCDRIISYAPMPESEMRKPRKDKEFCDSRCRQNYHYHNRIKPNRNPT